MTTDLINLLIERCQTARAKSGVVGEFSIHHYPTSVPPWYVGTYTPHDGKCTASGETLAEALSAWLFEFEYWWDAP